jgi:ABC-type uncharacterized transport system permease subunit
MTTLADAARRRVGGLSSNVTAAPLLIPLAIALTFLVTAVFVVIAGADPFEAYYRFLIGPLTAEFSLLEVLVAATPILFTGAAVAIAFRAGYYNIGAEGQLLAGAIAAAGLGMLVGGLPGPLAWLLMLGGGAIAGAAWALLPALLRVRFRIDEVVTTLLLNPVALLLVNALLNGPWRDPVTGFPESPPIAEAARFPELLDRSRLHLGFVLALVVVAVAWFVLTRTPAGLRLRAVGSSPRAAAFAGLSVERTLLAAALTSGAVAGLAGVSEVAGIQDRLTAGLSPGFGYTGIVVATLGGLTMPGVALAGLLLGDIRVGAGSAGRALGIPSQVGEIVQATLLLVTIGALAVLSRRGPRR